MRQKQTSSLACLGVEWRVWRCSGDIDPWRNVTERTSTFPWQTMLSVEWNRECWEWTRRVTESRTWETTETERLWRVITSGFGDNCYVTGCYKAHIWFRSVSLPFPVNTKSTTPFQCVTSIVVFLDSTVWLVILSCSSRLFVVTIHH